MKLELGWLRSVRLRQKLWFYLIAFRNCPPLLSQQRVKPRGEGVPPAVVKLGDTWTRMEEWAERGLKRYRRGIKRPSPAKRFPRVEPVPRVRARVPKDHSSGPDRKGLKLLPF